MLIQIARMLEFDGMWVAEQPADDDIRGHWDKMVISTRMWPDKYWDKFVKKKVSVGCDVKKKDLCFSLIVTDRSTVVVINCYFRYELQNSRSQKISKLMKVIYKKISKNLYKGICTGLRQSS